MPFFRSWLCLLTFCGVGCSLAAQPTRDHEIADADTRAWWHTTATLSGNAMEGRDTGSAAYKRAADYVSRRFAAAGLKPAGDSGTFFQTVSMHEVAVTREGTRFTVTRPGGAAVELHFLQEITVTATASLPPALDAPLTFRGYCGKDDVTGVADQIVVCFGTQRAGLPSGAERSANVRSAGGLAIVNVDDPFFTIEPPRWPFAYARSVTIQDPGAPLAAANAGGALKSRSFASMRLSAEAFAQLASGTGHDPQVLLEAGGHKQPLPSFEIPGKLHAEFHTT